MAGNRNRGGGGLVYHWRHGWIPRTPTAALQKAHGSRKGADKLMSKHGIEGDLPSGGKKADAPSTNRAAHSAPHTLKVGDRATVQGVDDSGSPIQFTGEVRGRTAVTMSKGGKKTPMLGITVKRESPTTGGMRHDTVYVPDPDRDPGKTQAARAAGSARDTLRRDLMAKYRGQGSSYKQQTRGIDPEVMSDGDLKKLRDSLHAEPEAAMLEEGRKLRADVDAEFAKRQAPKPSTTRATADTRATVRDLPSTDLLSGVHTETYKGNKISVRKGKEWGKLDVRINGQTFSRGHGRSNNDAVRELDSAQRTIDHALDNPDNYNLSGDNPTFGIKAPKAPKTASAHADRAAQLRAAAAKKRAEADRIANGAGVNDRAAAMLSGSTHRRQLARDDSALRRYAETQQRAKALESKAHLASARSKGAQQKADASALNLKAGDVSPGDLIMGPSGAHIVTKVNKTTVSIPSVVGGSWDDKLDLSKVSKHVKVRDLTDANLQRLHARSSGKAKDALAAEMRRRGLSAAA